MAWRDSRSQRKRLLLFALSIVAGIAALVAIHALRASVEAGVDAQAKSLLGSDLHIASRRPLDPDLVSQITARATRSAREISFATMLTFPAKGASRLVSLRGIQPDFPFYGKVETSPPDAWARLQSESGIFLEPALLDQFGAKVGDRVKVGSLELPIFGTLLKPPPRSSRFGGFAPEACVRFDDLARTGLLGTRSLASYDLHLEMPNAAKVRRVKQDFAAQPWRFETPENRRESLERALADMQQYLGLVALVALVLGAVGVAGAIHAHVQRRVGTVAILRCLGCPGDAAFAVYLAQALVLGIIGAIMGALLGIGLHAAVVSVLRGTFPVALSALPTPAILAQTTLAGFIVCAAFALLPLLAVRAVTPAAALREAPPAGLRRAWPIYLLLAALLTALSMVGTEHRLRALALNAGLLVAFLALAGTARLGMRLARRAVHPGWPYLLRQGVSNLYRPRNQTLLFLLSLGLGTFLLLTILLTRNLLLEKITLDQLKDSPSVYLIDVQPDQKEGVVSLIKAQGLPVLETAPMVTMRIQAVRGTPVRALDKQGEKIPRWILQREFRSTYRDQLSSTEKIVAGEWVASVPDPNGPVPLSLEKEIANDLHVKVGDQLTLDVQGQPIKARITSLREVDWSRFNLNFFMVFPPGVLEGAPGFEIVTTRLPAGVTSGSLQRLLIQKYPNVTAIDLTLILETVRSILGKITRAISIVALFTVVAGVPILIGTLLNGREQRRQESVLLRTLGASARQVRIVLLVEYAALGLLSALTAVVLAVAANAALAVFLFKASPWPSPALLAEAFVGTTLIAVLGGLALSRGIANHPPLEILRGL